jgi:hypothetical protein
MPAIPSRNIGVLPFGLENGQTAAN